ncbi:MAG: hypothetical protein RIQ79_2217 [Verrucomicrobiota bacterium]|jgi:hypothetical protein
MPLPLSRPHAANWSIDFLPSATPPPCRCSCWICSDAWPDEPLLLVLDGAGWHKARALPVPERLRLWHLPPYCPECNPSEHIWDETREKGFANQLFATLADVEVRLKTQLDELAADSNRLRSLTAFPWLAL